MSRTLLSNTYVMAFANGKSIWNRICKMARATEPIGQNQSKFLLIFQMTTWQRLLTNQNLHTLGEINKYKWVWFIIGLAKKTHIRKPYDYPVHKNCWFPYDSDSTWLIIYILPLSFDGQWKINATNAQQIYVIWPKRIIYNKPSSKQMERDIES